MSQSLVDSGAGWRTVQKRRGVAIPLVAASGPAGAAIALTAYALGVNGFLYWVGTRCP
ncbi:hypothetical protein JOF34_001394 [Microbacterium amylolyticum]|uniref:Uncharacterized protein n=1 Tax=Microbacterium amylolyticum TaxID=936337 RepID=A0ABS4ZIF5_9MICO|nr:hypothetical protein [Microbacterium amylolyticum]